jgi:hypothetical protein
MKRKVLKIAGISSILMILLLSSCTSVNSRNEKLNIIDIEGSINNYELVNLSSYASDLKYVRLETNDSTLIGAITNIVYECNKIYISDQSESIYVFDSEGKHLKTFNKKGRGPGEYNRITNFFVNPNNGNLYTVTSQALLCYDKELNFVEAIEKPENELFLISAKQIDVDIYGMVFNGKRHSIQIFDGKSKNVYYRKSAERESTENGHYMAKFTLFNMFQTSGELKYLSVLNDTIYSFTDDYKERPAYYLKYGKYREPNPVTVEDFGSLDLNFVSLLSIRESKELIFMNIFLRGNCKEPVISYATNPDGSQREIRYNAAYAVYDKKLSEFKILLQPVKGMLGFADDLTYGVPFWPRYISGSNNLVSYLTPAKIMSYAEGDNNAGEELKNLASKLSENDNPVVIITTPKK